ncbi:PIG-L family deacetylase [bacterium]|nr:MAG: PIG-L family deacetylase [bacterium]
MKYLIILPHPDDETYFVTGMIHKLKKSNNEIKIVILTKGGAGKNYIKRTPIPWGKKIAKQDGKSLEQIRSIEFENAMKILKIENYRLFDFEDGGLNAEKSKIKDLIIEQIESFKPDSVITYDNTGVTGHPDHIIVSEILYNLQKLDKFTFELLLITGGQFEIQNFCKLENYKHKFDANLVIQLSIFDTIRKIRAINIYKSQFPILKRIQIFAKFIIDPKEYFIKIIDHEPIFEFVEFEI